MLGRWKAHLKTHQPTEKHGVCGQSGSCSRNVSCRPSQEEEKETRNNNILASNVWRWSAGKRGTLWREVVRYTGAAKEPKKRHRPVDKEKEAERRREEVVSLARRGLPGKAMQHTMSEGLAPDTPENGLKIRKKFPPPPVEQSTSRRMGAPAANEITEADLVGAIYSFQKGVATGPSGQRPDFYKQLIGDKGDKPAVALLTSMANLLASGRAPPELRPYIGGARCVALKRTAKDGREDVRPACAGEHGRLVWSPICMRCKARRPARTG